MIDQINGQITTGLKELDSFWEEGLSRRKLLMIAARPAMGKTSFLISIAKLIAQRHTTLLFSLEHPYTTVEKKYGMGPLLWNDASSLEVQDVVKIAAKSRAEVVLIDYIQLLDWERSALIQTLKNLATEQNICILATSQLGRDLEYRDEPDRRPKLGDLFGIQPKFHPSSLAYIDQLTFMYREQRYNLLTNEVDVVELIDYSNNQKRVLRLDWNHFA